MFNKLKRFFDSIESAQIGFGWWMVCFSCIIFIRNFLEGALESVKTIGCVEDPYLSIIIFTSHYPLLYISQFLILVILVRLLTRERIERISKTVIAFWIIWFPPIFDFIWSGGKGEDIAYPHNFGQVWDFFVNCANPWVSFPQTAPPGIRIEFVIACVLSIVYIFIKTRNLIKSLAGALLFYISFIFYVFGFLVILAYGWHALFPQMPPPADAGTLPYEQVFYAPSLIPIAFLAPSLLYLLVIVIGLFTWYYLYDRQRCLALVKNIRLTRSIHFCGMTLAGILLGYLVEGYNFFGVFGNPIDYLACGALCLSIFFAFQSMVVVNDIFDVDSDRISNPGRPLTLGAIPLAEYKIIGWIYFLLAAFLAFNVSLTALLIVLFFEALYLVYSAPPLRLKRFFPLNMMVIGINTLVALLLGYSIFGGVKTVDKVPAGFMILIPLGFFLAANIITIKDIEADSRTGVMTLPVLLGEKWGKIVIAFLALLSFLAVPLILAIPQLWLVSIPFGILAGVWVLMPKWRENLFFITYFIYAVIAACLIKLYTNY